MSDATPANLLRDLPPRGPEERFADILARPGLRVERIVSTGQATPVEQPMCQPHDEWVLLLAGAAGLWVEGSGERFLTAGDHMLISAGTPHRVTFTADAPTIWLALHLLTEGATELP